MHGIREAVPDDCREIGEIHVAAWRETYAGHLPDRVLAELSAARRAAIWSRSLEAKHPDFRLLVAEDGGGLVGFGACRRADAGTVNADGEVVAIYLLRRAQRRGTGRALLTSLFSLMALRGMRSAGLWVLRENTGARGFYRRLGASEGRHRTEAIGGVPAVEIACCWAPIPGRPVASGAGATT
jgi:ribosomal protein S18 acetylase RimI-like enzyme